MFILKMGWGTSVIRELMAILCQLIYPLISWLYSLFMNISKVNILSSEEIKPIYQRVTLILTIVMVFYITFEFVKFIVQPDGITDKEKGVGNIIYKMVIVVVLIAFVPTIFTGAFKLQNAIVDQGIIGKLIIGQTKSNDPATFGKTFSANLFSMFYSVDDEYKEEKCDGIACGNLVAMNIGFLAENGELTYLTKGLDSVKKVDAPIDGERAEVALINFSFNGLLPVIVGAVVAYILAMYCIDVGVRWAQMVFLQIIAPIPIIGYLSPKKDGMFQKWFKQCLTTYLDLFIRIAIIYFILLICTILMESRINGKLLEGLGELGGWMETFIYIALILGVMIFAQKAPKMLSELFPKTGAASGNFGLKPDERIAPIKKAIKPMGRVAGAAAGATIGAAAGIATGIGQGLRKRHSAKTTGGKIAAGTAGAIWGAVRGAVGGATQGVVNGGKKGNVLKNSIAGAQKQVEDNKRFGNRAENGYTLGHQIGDRARNLVGARSRTEALESQKEPLKRKKDAYSSFTKATDDIRDYAWKKAQDGKSKYIGEYKAAEGRINMYRDKTDAELTAMGIDPKKRQDLINEAVDDMKKYKDLATDDYIDREKAKDVGLMDMFATRDNDLEQYNLYAAESDKISDKTTIEIKYKDSSGNDIIVPAGTPIKDLSSAALDAYNKSLKTETNKLVMQISSITTKQDSIKRETEGSGIGEGKK